MAIRALRKLVTVIVALVLVQLSCSLSNGLPGSSKSSEPPYYGVFILDGNNFIEVPQTEGMPASKNDKEIPSMASSDEEIIIWYPNIKLEYLTLNEYGELSGKQVDFNITPIDEEMYKIGIRSNIDPGVYCLIQGNPLGSPYSLPTWCFRIGEANNETNLNESVQIATPSDDGLMEPDVKPAQVIKPNLLFELDIPYAANGIGVIVTGEMGLEWSPNGKYLVVRDFMKDRSIFLIDFEKQDYQVINSYFDEEYIEGNPSNYLINDISWSPDSNMIAVAGHSKLEFLGESIPSIEIIDVNSRSLFSSYVNPHGIEGRLPPHITQVDWSSDLNMIATSDQSGIVKVWDPISGNEINKLDYYDGEGKISVITDWATDNRKLAIGSPEPLKNNQIVVWDVQSNNVITNTSLDYFYGREQFRNGIALGWNPDGIHLAIADNLGNVNILDTSTKNFVTIDPSLEMNLLIDWHPNGKVIAIAGKDGTTFWESNGNLIDSFEEMPSAILAWSEDGNYLATIPYNTQKLQVWEVETKVQ